MNSIHTPQGLENKESNKLSSPTKIQFLVTALLSVLTMVGCGNKSSIDVNESRIARDILEEYDDFQGLSRRKERMHRENIEEAIITMEEILSEIVSNSDMQKFIGKGGVDHATVAALLSVAIPESRGNEEKEGSSGEEGLFQITPGTHRQLIKKYGKQSGWKNMRDENFAGAVVYLQGCTQVQKLIDQGVLDPLDEKEFLQMAYMFHNRGNAKDYIERLGLDDREDFEEKFTKLLKKEGFNPRRRKRWMKNYNKNQSPTKQQLVTKLRRLQLIRKKVIHNSEIKKMRPTYVAGYSVGLIHDIVE